MFGRLKDKLMGGAQKLAGRTDLLEGIAAGCAMVSCADAAIAAMSIRT